MGVSEPLTEVKRFGDNGDDILPLIVLWTGATQYHSSVNSLFTTHKSCPGRCIVPESYNKNR